MNTIIFLSYKMPHEETKNHLDFYYKQDEISFNTWEFFMKNIESYERLEIKFSVVLFM